jgi:hypothetical protein
MRIWTVIFLSLLIVSNTVADTTHYLDPDWGGTESGTEAQPWASLNWTTINSDLASGNVTVYFSADDSQATNITFSRTDTGPYRLTLDGISYYNTNDVTPSWAAGNGTDRYTVTANYPITTGSTRRNRITLNGFKVVSTQGQIIYWVGGDGLVITNNDLSHDSGATGGPGVYIEYCKNASYEQMGCNGITIQGNTIYDTYGEGIYIGGCRNDLFDCSTFTNLYHQNVLIDNNTLTDIGKYGGEGDAIDPHGNIDGLVVSDNIVAWTNVTDTYGRDGICPEVSGTIERNIVINAGRNGISLLDYWNEANAWRDNPIVRNNIVINCGGGRQSGGAAWGWNYGIYVQWSETFSTNHWTNVDIYNNTVFGTNYSYGGSANGDGINIAVGNAGVDVVNNISSQSDGIEFYAGSGTLDTHDYNLYYDTSGNIYSYSGTTVAYNADITGQEANSISNDNPDFINNNAPFEAINFKLESVSPAIDEGSSLTETFTNDFDGKTRSGVWDIGAYEYDSGSSSASGITSSGIGQ